jgi:hypothetical protein
MKARFFLFANSYSAKKISIYLKGKFGGKKLTKAIEKLSVVLNFEHCQVADFIMLDLKPVSPYKRIPISLKIYLEIESELSKLSEEKLDKYSTALEDYQRRLLCPAIERAVGNLLENIDDDTKFQKLMEEKFKSSFHMYYKVARKYGLPTMRNIPFVMSIIS